MAKKQNTGNAGSPGDAADDELDAVFDEFIDAGDYEIAIVWRPGQSNPVTCGHLRVNGVVLASDQEFLSSPQVYRLPAPIRGKFAIDWSLTPEVPLDLILIGIVNWNTHAKVTVDSKKSATRSPWPGQKVVNAP